MALVEIARFLDLPEAQAAASALRASGMQVFMQNENWGQTEAYLQLAMGGFALWTPEEDASDARAFLDTVRRQAPPPAEAAEGSVAPAALALLASLVLGPVTGWLLAPFAPRRTRED